MFRLLSINLRLHDGAAAPAASPAPAAAPAASAPGGGKTKPAEPKVVYGKQPESAPEAGTEQKGPKETPATSSTLEERKAAFEKLIGGEYKDLYDARIKDSMDRRFKATANLQAQVDGMTPIMDTLRQKYGLAESADAKAVLDAIDKDSKYWEEAAEKAGMSVEQYKQVKQLERDNAALRKAQQETAQRSFAQNQLAEWMTQAEKMKAGAYPGFDLATESTNPQFVSMLRSGVSVEAAYKAIHFDELAAGAATEAGKRAEKATLESVKAKQDRPGEVGATGAPGVIVKNDVTQLTPEDRRRAVEQARRGEVVRFS